MYYYYIITGLVFLGLILGFYFYTQKVELKILKVKLEAGQKRLEALAAEEVYVEKLKTLYNERIQALETELKSYQDVLVSMSPSPRSARKPNKVSKSKSVSEVDPILSLYVASEILDSEYDSRTPSSSCFSTSSPSASFDSCDRSSSYSGSFSSDSSSSSSSSSSSDSSSY